MKSIPRDVCYGDDEDGRDVIRCEMVVPVIDELTIYLYTGCSSIASGRCERRPTCLHVLLRAL